MNFLARIGEFSLRSQLQAGLLAFVCSLPAVIGVPFIAWLGMMVVGLVSLRRGFTQGLIVMIWSALPSFVLFCMGDMQLFCQQILLGTFILFLLAMLLRVVESWSLVIEIATWIAVAAVLIMHACIPNLYEYWHQYLLAMAGNIHGARDLTTALSDRAWFYMTHTATGLAVAGVMVNGLFNLLVARGWQAALFNPGGLKQEFFHIRLSRFLVILLLIVLVLLFAFKIELMWDALPILVLAYFVNGLSLLHWKFAQLKWMWFFVVIYYVLLVFWFVIIGSLTALMGLLDSLIDSRKRFSKQL